jgi:hypothetical protein
VLAWVCIKRDRPSRKRGCEAYGVRSPHYRARERRIAFHFFHLVHVALAMRGQEQKPLVTVERA